MRRLRTNSIVCGCPDGCRLSVVVQAGAGAPTPAEEAVARILIELLEPGGGRRSFGCFPILSVHSRSFLYRFLNAFVAFPTYRERWALEDPQALVWRHPVRTVPIGGIGVEIDAAIAEPIRTLNARGYRTAHSCQGTDQPYDATLAAQCGAHLVFRTPLDIPHDLAAAVRGAGFSMDGNTLAVRSPLAVQHLANLQFRQLLGDWATGRLDRSGVSYQPDPHRRWRAQPPFVPQTQGGAVGGLLSECRLGWRRWRSSTSP